MQLRLHKSGNNLFSFNYNFTTCCTLPDSDIAAPKTRRPYSYLTPVVTALQPLLNHQINPKQIPPYHQTPHWTHLLHLTMITLWLLSKSGIHCPKTFPDYRVYYSTKHPLCALHTLATTTEPSSYTQAVKFKEWQKAMQDEFSASHANDSWSLCPRPANKNVIRNKWVYKLKQALLRGSRPNWWLRDSNNKMVTLDYKETFSPNVKPATIRVVLELAIHFN